MAWEEAVAIGAQMSVFILFYVGLKLDKQDNKYLGIVFMFMGMFSQLGALEVMQEVINAQVSPKLDVLHAIEHIFGAWTYMITFAIIYYAMVVLGEVVYYTTGYDIWAKVKRSKEA